MPDAPLEPVAGARDQRDLDRSNETFWNELCGSGLAKAVGIQDASPDSLARFDRAYMDLYPYLWRYVPGDALRGKKVLEIGLGYGTLGQILNASAGDYYGVDLAAAPVAMMRHRLQQSGRAHGAAVQASVLDLPFRDSAFDRVYSIGCLHHTGNVQRGVDEVHRVLATNGEAVIMLYHRHSFRRLVQAPLQYVRRARAFARGRGMAEFIRALYDTNSEGGAAPHTDFLSRADVRRVFRKFSSVTVESQNFDAYVLFKGRLVIPRERLLGNVGRIMGLDLYVIARK